MIQSTPLGPTEYRSDDDFLTKVRKAIAMSGRVGTGPIPIANNIANSNIGPGRIHGLVPMDETDPADVALTQVYIEAAFAQRDFPAFLMSMVEAYCTEEDATLFKMFWAGRS